MHRRLSGAVLSVALLCGCSHGAIKSSPSPGPIVTGNYPQYGHAADFSWVAGKMAQRLGGCAYLVFGSPAAAPWGGRIALVAKPETLAPLSGGDMVVAFGRISTAPHGNCGGAALEVDRIQEH